MNSVRGDFPLSPFVTAANRTAGCIFRKKGCTPVLPRNYEGLFRADINTAVSASRLYWETAHHVPTRQIAFFAVTGGKIPVAVSAYPDELYTAPRTWTEQAYPRLIHYNLMAKGGHFAAWEQPQSFSEELRASFRSLS